MKKNEKRSHIAPSAFPSSITHAPNKHIEIIIEMHNGIVKSIKSKILFELRNIDFGFLDYTEAEILRAACENRALLMIKDKTCHSIFLPSGVTLDLNIS